MKIIIVLIGFALILCGFSLPYFEKLHTAPPQQEVVVKQQVSLLTPVDVIDIQHESPSLSTYDVLRAHMSQIPNLVLDRREKVVDSLVKLVYIEANVEGVEGWIPIVGLVIERYMSKHFPNSITEVVFEETPGREACPYQFDALCTKKDLDVDIEDARYKEIEEIVRGVLSGEIRNTCPGAHHYYNPKDKSVVTKPYFASDKTYLCTIGNHKFYRMMSWPELVVLRKKRRDEKKLESI